MRLYLGSYFTFFTLNGAHWIEVNLPRPMRLSEVLVSLKIPPAEVHLIVKDNRVIESTDVVVYDTDTIRIYPGVNGG